MAERSRCDIIGSAPAIQGGSAKSSQVESRPMDSLANVPSSQPDLPNSPHAFTELADGLEQFCEARTVRGRSQCLVRLIGWLRAAHTRESEQARFLSLVEYLESHEPVRSRFRASFGGLLAEMDSLSLFAEAGIPSDHSFFSEIVQRLAGRLVPSARAQSDTAKLLIRLYSSEGDVRRFLAIPSELFQRLVAVLTPPGSPEFWARQSNDLQQALRLLASRVGGRGLEPEMRDRGAGTSIADSPFYRLVLGSEALLDAVASGRNVSSSLDTWKQAVSQCRLEMSQVHAHMESAGVSVELIFDLKKIEACLSRMEAIVNVLVASSSAEQCTAAQDLLGRLMEGRLADRSVRALLRGNLNLIARKMVERTGHSGEHYIAHSRAEYWQMWRAAVGGGLLTVFTAALKMRIVDAQLPPFVEGFLSGTNYAVSFVVLQILGLVLATKQPAATAATFAGIIRDNKGLARESKLTDFVAHITSTQLAAAIGNVAAVTIGAVVFERLWRWFFSNSYLPQQSATHVYETLHPFASGTAFYAIVTGVILWMAALAGGWFENFAVYYRLADAITQHPLGGRIGERRMRRIAHILDRNLGGWSTSVVLGYLLGFTPVLGHFFGVPLDVRHVTLSTGTLALAAARFGTASLGHAWFYYAVEGIAVIFVLNLTVSFTIAAYVALRAYDVSPAEQWHILRFVLADAAKSPLRFFWPSDLPETPTPHPSPTVVKE